MNKTVRLEMRWLSRNWFLLLIYAALVVSLSAYIDGRLTYRGLESWPSVDAEIMGFGGSVTTIPGQGRYGVSNSTMDTRFTQFRYSIEGREYANDTVSPNENALPLNPFNRPWRAYYNPENPETAVLIPVAYRGTNLLVLVSLSGLFVILHLWFTVSEWFARKMPNRVPMTD